MKNEKVSRKSSKLAPKKPVADKARAAPVAPVVTTQSLVVPHVAETLVADIRPRITAALVASIETDVSAASPDEIKLGMPVAVYCKEAVGVACVVERHTHPRDGVETGFIHFRDRLGGDVPAMLVYLVDELSKCENMLAQEGAEESDALPKRGYEVLVEIRSACEVVVDDGVTDEKDKLVLGLRKKHESHPKSLGGLALALAGYASAGQSLVASLSSLHGFDIALLEEAKKIADLLLGRGIGSSDGMRSVRARRNRLVAVIQKHLKRSRKLARFVFRKYPSILRDMASAFHRTRRSRDEAEPEPGDEDLDEDAPTPEPSDDPT